MKLKPTVSLVLLLALTSVGLSGCSDGSTADLRAYIKKTLARKGGRIEELPPIPPYEVATYTAKKDPFEPFFEEDSSDTTAQPEPEQNDENQPIPHSVRGKQELEDFSLDSLRMLGSVEISEVIYGIVRDPGGIIHRVKEGDFIGRNFGRVEEISETEILLREKFQDSQKRWQDRDAALTLVQ